MIFQIWWAKLLCTGDKSGRTPLHYAVGSSADKDVLEALILNGRGMFYEKINDKKVKNRNLEKKTGGNRGILDKPKNILRSLFNKRSIYDLASGREMATYDEPSYALQLTHGPTSTAQPKSSTRKDFTLTTSTRTLRHIAWDLAGSSTISGTLDPSAGKNDASYHLDYDIIVPWILRNMLRCSIDRSNARNSDGVDYLEDLLVSAEPSRTGVFVVAELGAVLGELGIRVTTDVLRELCRRYPGTMNTPLLLGSADTNKSSK